MGFFFTFYLEVPLHNPSPLLSTHTIDQTCASKPQTRALSRTQPRTTTQYVAQVAARPCLLLTMPHCLFTPAYPDASSPACPRACPPLLLRAALHHDASFGHRWEAARAAHRLVPAEEQQDSPLVGVAEHAAAATLVDIRGHQL